MKLNRVALFSLCAAQSTAEQVSIHIPSSDTRLTGNRYKSPNVETFHVRYAQAARFSPASIVSLASGTLDTSSPLPRCPQSAAARHPLAPTYSEEDQSEDCLSVTITRSAQSISSYKLPVLVWVHGGSDGGSAKDAGSADRLVGQAYKLEKPLVHVDVEYRVGLLGFGKEGLARGDISAALEWIKMYIDAFGGDKERISLYGAGGKGLLGHEGIRGVWSVGGALGRAKDSLSSLDKVLGGSKCVGKKGTVDWTCLEKVELSELIASEDKALAELHPVHMWSHESPLAVAAASKQANTSLVLGWTQNDGSIHMPHGEDFMTEEQVKNVLSHHFPSITAPQMKRLLELYDLAEFEEQQRAAGSEKPTQWLRASHILTDLRIKCPSIGYAYQLHKKAGIPVRVFSLNSTVDESKLRARGLKDYGIAHGSEIAYSRGVSSKESPEQQHYSDKYMTALINFAATGNPTFSGVPWATAFDEKPVEAFTELGSPANTTILPAQFSVLVMGGPNHGGAATVSNPELIIPGSDAGFTAEDLMNRHDEMPIGSLWDLSWSKMVNAWGEMHSKLMELRNTPTRHIALKAEKLFERCGYINTELFPIEL